MRKYLLSLLLVLSLTACGDKAQEISTNGKPTIKIGGIFPLSGSQASMGEAARAGMLQALAEINQDNLHYKYELVFEDNQGKLSVMPTVTNKMISSDKVDVMGTWSVYARIMAPIADQQGVVQWGYSFEDKNYERFGKYAFNQGIATQDVAEAMYNILLNDGADNISVFAQNYGIMASVIKDMENKFKQNNLKYVINTFNPGERDFRITIAKNKEEGFTKFLVMAMLPEKDIILKQLVESNIAKSNLYASALDMAKATELYEGIKTVTFYPGSTEFLDIMEKHYNLNSTYGAIGFYDFVNLIIDTYEHLYKEGQKPTAEEVTAYIHAKKKYKCGSGECVVQDNGFIVNQPTVRIYKNNKWQNIE